MTAALKKYKSMVFGPNSVKNEAGRKRYTSESDATSTEVDVSRRRVSFADIDELHMRFGAPSRPCDTGGTRRGSITNIGYINRNCAVYINQMDPLSDETPDTSETTEDSVIAHIDVIHENSGVKRHVVTREPYEITFGKKGKNVGEFRDATGITYISRGHVLVTDMINGRIQRCARDGETSAVYGGEEICEPWCTCITQEGHIALTSRYRKIVKIVSKDGDVLWSFGAGFFQRPSGVCVNHEGKFIVTDTLSNRVSIHETDGKFVKYVGNPKLKEQQFSCPRYVCVSHRDDIIVSDSGHHCVKVFDKNGHYIRSIGRFGKNYGELKTPYGVCTDSLGHVLVADHYNNRISMFTAEGAFVCHVVDDSHGLTHPKGLALSPDLNLYVSIGHLKACEIKVFKLKCPDPTFVVDV